MDPKNRFKRLDRFLHGNNDEKKQMNTNVNETTQNTPSIDTQSSTTVTKNTTEINNNTIVLDKT